MRDRWLDFLRHDASAFRAAAGEADLDKPVPPCPKWTVEGLVGHLGGVYRWAYEVLSTRSEADRRVGGAAPAGRAVLEWWDRAYTQLTAILEKVEPDEACWTWPNLSPDLAGFWHRRMAHETAVHRWDMQTATRLPEPLDAAQAADGIAEALDTFLPSGRRTGEPAVGVARLIATDVERDWLVRQREGGAVSLLDQDSVGYEPPAVDAVASGTASDVLLMLWGRVPLSTLTVEGAPALVESLRVR